MTEDIKPEVIKMTQYTLGKFIKKPPLTEKLLKKPPFRFLHDITTSVIRDTGFLSGLYSDKEMMSDNIKDRDMKIAFLQKLIDTVKIVTERNITAKPSKIVAGLDPAKTNELLQAIGFALEKKLDSSSAIAQINGDQAPVKIKNKSKESKDEKKTSHKSKEKTDDKDRHKAPTNETPREKKLTETNKLTRKPSTERVPLVSQRSKESPRVKNEKPKEEAKKEKLSSNKPDKKERKLKEAKDKSPRVKQSIKIENSLDTKNSPKEKQVTEEIKQTGIEKSEKIKDVPEDIIVPEANKSGTIPIEKSEDIIAEFQTNIRNEIQIPEEKHVEEMKEQPEKRSAKKERVLELEQEPGIMMSKEQPKKEGIIRPKTSLRPPSVRPSSARPGAPRLKDRNDVILPADELVPLGKVNVIVENFSTHEEDNEETVVVESAPELTFQEPVVPKTDIPAEKGHLVAQILEQLGDSAPETTETKPRTEIEWETGGNRNREAASREMEKLRESIQTLTRAANPLGKLMNFLQEDVDSMRSELKMWMEVNEKLAVEIKTQERLNEESIQPLQKQLVRLEEDIVKQNEQIIVTQANILRNELKIKTLLTRNG